MENISVANVTKNEMDNLEHALEYQVEQFEKALKNKEYTSVSNYAAVISKISYLIGYLNLTKE